MSCVFCDIVAGKEPADLVLDNAHCVVFHSKSKQMKTHLLVIPREHFESLDHMRADEQHVVKIGALYFTAAEAARKLGLNGYKLITNVGRAGGQRVMHVHIHILSTQAMKV